MQFITRMNASCVMLTIKARTRARRRAFRCCAATTPPPCSGPTRSRACGAAPPCSGPRRRAQATTPPAAAARRPSTTAAQPTAGRTCIQTHRRRPEIAVEKHATQRNQDVTHSRDDNAGRMMRSWVPKKAVEVSAHSRAPSVGQGRLSVNDSRRSATVWGRRRYTLGGG